MYTITDIITDINRGCMANNMIEDKFSYRILFYVNEGNKGRKSYIDTSYADIRKSLESIIRENLSLTNNIVIAKTTVLKHGKAISLQSKAYCFSLDEYLNRINGECQKQNNREKGSIALCG